MDENVSSTTSSSSGIQDYYNLIKAEHEANNAWSAEQAQKAMDYQTEMSNTAHQREVADLKAAGLNPVLSAGGSGATTGSGIAAQRSDENVQALYGLTKQAIENTTEIAKAMANSAKYVSGSGGYSSAYSSSGDFSDDIKNALADYVKRKFGISQGTTLSILDKVTNLWPGLNDVLAGQFFKTESEWKEGDVKSKIIGNKILKGAKASGNSYAPIKVSNNSFKGSYYKTGYGRPVHVTGVAKGLNSAKNAIKRVVS